MVRPVGLFSVTLQYTLGAGAEIAQNVFWFDGGAALTPATLATAVNVVGNGVADYMSGPWGTALTSDLVQTGALAHAFDSDGDPISAAANLTTPAHGAGSSSLPYEVAVVASLRTDFAGRSYRGRSYQGPISQTAVTTSGRLTSTARTGIGNGLAQYLSHMDSLGYRPVVWSRTKNIATHITSVVVDDVFDVQRRRQNALVPVKATFPVT